MSAGVLMPVGPGLSGMPSAAEVTVIAGVVVFLLAVALLEILLVGGLLILFRRWF